jgi:hypothetical protein
MTTITMPDDYTPNNATAAKRKRCLDYLKAHPARYRGDKVAYAVSCLVPNDRTGEVMSDSDVLDSITWGSRSDARAALARAKSIIG